MNVNFRPGDEIAAHAVGLAVSPVLSYFLIANPLLLGAGLILGIMAAQGAIAFAMMAADALRAARNEALRNATVGSESLDWLPVADPPEDEPPADGEELAPASAPASASAPAE